MIKEIFNKKQIFLLLYWYDRKFLLKLKVIKMNNNIIKHLLFLLNCNKSIINLQI